MSERGVADAILIGYLGNEPDIRTLPSGDQVANFQVASNESWKDKNTGQMRERVDWHNIVVYSNALVEAVVKPYVHKGTHIYVRAKIRNRKWTGADQVDRVITEFVVDMNGKIQLLDPIGNRPGQTQSSGQRAGDEPPPF